MHACVLGYMCVYVWVRYVCVCVCVWFFSCADQSLWQTSSLPTSQCQETIGFGHLSIKCDGPKDPVPIEIKNNDDRMFSCLYNTDDIGKHKVKVGFNHKPTAKSHYM